MIPFIENIGLGEIMLILVTIAQIVLPIAAIVLIVSIVIRRRQP